MIKILYNPLSSNGKSMEIVDKVISQFKELNKEYELINVTEINDTEEFISTFNDEDEFILIGGDGTLHRLANRITPYLRQGKIKNKLFLYRAGTGNDFSRDVKKEIKDNMVYLNDHLRYLPTIEFNGESRFFVNGVGLGIDALICKMVNESEDKSTKNYLKNVIKSLKNYHKSPVKVIVDGKEYNYSKALFATIMHGRYYGGGMKIIPSQKRDTDELSVIVINRMPTPILALLLPTVFFGGHTILPGIHIHKGKNIEIIFDEDKYLQLDGEVEENVKTIKAYKQPL